MSLNYSSILSKAWNIAWKYKVLWIFGFFVMFGDVSINFNTRISSNSSTNPSYSEIQHYYPYGEKVTQSNNSAILAVVIGICCCLAFCILGLWLLSVLGTGGLIGGIVKADSAGSLTFREAWAMGRQFFVRILLIHLAKVIINIVIALLIIFPGSIIGVLTCGLGFIPLCCASIFIGAAANILFYLMDNAVVMENRTLGDAMVRGWSMFRDHLGPAILLYLIEFGVSLLVLICAMIVILPFSFVVFGVLTSLSALQPGLSIVVMIVAGILMLILLILLWLGLSVFTVWKRGIWAFAYQEFLAMSTPPVPAAPLPPIAPVPPTP